MRTRIILFLSAILFTANLRAQDAPPQFEHIQDLEPFIGEWEGKYDPPGDVPLGTVRVRCQWMGSKGYCHFEGLFTPDGTGIELNPVNIFIGYSGKTKKVHSWHLELGSHANAPVKITKNKVQFDVRDRYSTDGVRETRVVTYELRSPDELVGRNTHIIRGGEAKPDHEPLVLKRVK